MSPCVWGTFLLIILATIWLMGRDERGLGRVPYRAPPLRMVGQALVWTVSACFLVRLGMTVLSAVRFPVEASIATFMVTLALLIALKGSGRL